MKKKVNLRSVMIGAAALAAGAFVSIPALVPVPAFAATEATEATEASGTTVVSRTIHFYYKNDDGTLRAVKSNDNGDFTITRFAVFPPGDTSVKEIEGYKVPAIAGYTPDKSYVDAIKVTASSKPADVNVYYTENPDHKKTYTTEEQKVSRNITFYRVGDDGKAVQTYHGTQSANIRRTVTTYGNGKKEYSDWASYTFPSVSVPAMEGYTPSLAEVPAVTASPDNPPKDVNVYYRKTSSNVKDSVDLSTFTVTFTDGLGKTLKTQSVAASKAATAPAAPSRAGYTFAGWDKDFSNVRGNLTVNAKWTANKTESVTEEKTVKRTINYYHADGSPVTNNGTPCTEYYSHTFRRIGTKDTVTGKVTWGSWTPDTTFPECTPMQYSGYTPDKKVIPAQKVSPTTNSWTVNVYYTKNGEKSVGVTGIKLNKTVAYIKGDSSQVLSATISPSNATNKKIIWSSSDPAIVSVDSNGKITGKKRGGVAIIKATTQDGNKVASCRVRVIFDDVPASYANYKEVYWAAEKGIFDDAKTFSPSKSVTRGEMIDAIWKMKNKPSASLGTKGYTDVSKNSKYYKSSLWAKSNNIFVQDSNGKFNPNVKCTIKEEILFLWRLAGKPTVSSNIKFADVEKNSKYYSAFAWAVSKGIVKKDSVGRVNPNNGCSRRVSVVYLYRYNKIIK